MARTRNQRIARLEATQARVARELEELKHEKYIDEPLPDPKFPEIDSAPPIIYFEKRFSPDGYDYRYAAIRTHDGRWFTSGPRGGHVPRQWDDLVDWITEHNPDATILLLTGHNAGFEVLNS